MRSAKTIRMCANIWFVLIMVSAIVGLVVSIAMGLDDFMVFIVGTGIALGGGFIGVLTYSLLCGFADIIDNTYSTSTNTYIVAASCKKSGSIDANNYSGSANRNLKLPPL